MTDTPRKCSYCGEHPVGPGGVLCPDCKTLLEDRNRAITLGETPDVH